MTGEEWLAIVQAAIAKSGLPYRVSSCGCSRNTPTSFATVEHQRTKALREIVLSRALFSPEEIPNEIIRQLRMFNIDFVAPCAKGHMPILQFERDELEQLLERDTLTFSCTLCNASRPATAEERVDIRRLLAESAAATVARRSRTRV